MFLWQTVKWFYSVLVGRAIPGLRGDALTTVVNGLVEQNGAGLNALLEKFSKGGLDAQVQSWVGKGANMPLSPQQLRGILGDNAVSEIAGQLGKPADATASKLSRTLPQLIDQLTPEGQVPDKETVGQRLANALKEWSF